MCQCCFPPSSPHFTPSPPPVVTRRGPGARLLPAAVHRVKITSNEPRHKWQLMRNLHNNCLHQILGKQQHCLEDFNLIAVDFHKKKNKIHSYVLMRPSGNLTLTKSYCYYFQLTPWQARCWASWTARECCLGSRTPNYLLRLPLKVITRYNY